MSSGKSHHRPQLILGEQYSSPYAAPPRSAARREPRDLSCASVDGGPRSQPDHGPHHRGCAAVGADMLTLTPNQNRSGLGRTVQSGGEATVSARTREGVIVDASDQELQQYLFDLQGYLVIHNVLGTAEVAELNRLIDAQQLPSPRQASALAPPPASTDRIMA